MKWFLFIFFLPLALCAQDVFNIDVSANRQIISQGVFFPNVGHDSYVTWPETET